jgi:small subunit ribosomal protein S6
MSITRGTHREYETIFVMRPDAGDEITKNVRERIEGVFTRLNGHVIQWDDWGKRKLAFEIRDRTALKHHAKGYYIHLHYAGGNDLVAELERNLRMQEAVLRYLTVRLDEDFDLDAVRAADNAEQAN